MNHISGKVSYKKDPTEIHWLFLVWKDDATQFNAIIFVEPGEQHTLALTQSTDAK